MASSTSVVLAALVANGAIAILKFLAWGITGSPSMLSEAYHSVSDTGNQVFLLVGIWFGGREASRRHPFGYGKAQFFYSFLVSVLLFGIAGWESATHGLHEVQLALAGDAHLPEGTVTLLGMTFPQVYVNYAVLSSAIVFESWAFLKAYRGMQIEIDEHDWSGFREAFKKTANVTMLTALTEDTIALLGLALALVGIVASQLTGDPLYDAISALLIGVMLMLFAVALAWENKRLLLGESLPEEDQRRLRKIAEGWEGILHVEDFRTVYFGPDDILVTADVSFDPEFDTGEIDDRISDLEDAIRESEPDVTKVYVEPEV